MQRSNNSLFWQVFAILVVIGSFIFSWQYTIPKYKQNQQDHALVVEEVAAASEKLASLKTAKTSIDSLGSIVDQMIVAIAPDKDTANVISELEAIAAASQTYIPSFQISDGQTAGQTTAVANANAVTIGFSVSGSFANLSKFLDTVENDTKFFSIKSITVSSTDSTTTMSIQLLTLKQTNSSLSGITN